MRPLRALWDTAPRDIWRKGTHRLFRRGTPDFEGILRSPKNSNPQMFYNFLARYEVILGRTHGWRPLDFIDRDVLEIGCGPMLGFGPLAIFRGCRSYTAIEPGYLPEVTYHLGAERYYLSVHKDLSAIYGPRMEYETFRALLRDRVRIVARELTAADAPARADIVLSNSALEHLIPLNPSVAAIVAHSGKSARFLHLADFGNHRASRSPFSGMYSIPPDEYHRRHGRGINLARGKDMVAAFRAAGIEAGLQPYYSFPEFHEEPIHSWWRERYTLEELFLKAGLVFG